MRRRRKQHNRRRGGIGLSAAVALCLAGSLLMFARMGGEQWAQQAVRSLAENGDFISRAGLARARADARHRRGLCAARRRGPRAARPTTSRPRRGAYVPRRAGK